MKKILKVVLMLCCCMCVSAIQAIGQDSTLMLDKTLHAPDRLIGQVDKKARELNERLVKQTDKYMNSLRNQEEKLRKKVFAIDTLAAMRIFDEAREKYAALQEKVKGVGSKVAKFSGTYLPHLDSVKTAFNFLGNSADLFKSKPELEGKLKGAMESMGTLQNRFAEAEEVKRFIKQRQLF